MEESCYNGGDIAGAIFGTLIAVVVIAAIIYWLYIKRINKKRQEAQLMNKKDPEHADDNYAFDNPAFKGDSSKMGFQKDSPLNPTWTPKLNGGEKRKAMDDTFMTPTPRVVPLRGSDFTGLGIELTGGIKEGIYVKKVMAQGPAASTVNSGDRILSITIDFRHIVQEDAMTILSYASPYNVQLELVDGKGLTGTTNSPKSGRSTLQHPLYRSSSQGDMNTIERNARKNLFSDNDISNEEKGSMSPSTKIKVHRENEKKPSLKQQVKNFVTEKLQTKHADPEKFEKLDHHHTETETNNKHEDGKKGLKFGIRVLPPSVGEKFFGKSPSKIQADNENNLNIEKNECEKSVKGTEIKTSLDEPDTFERQCNINSSGIRRDAAGIPQEVPNHMMQAAMAAKDHRKSANLNSADVRKSKNKAPCPPSTDSNTGYGSNTDFDPDMTDHAKMLVEEAIQSATQHITKMNFSDHFHDTTIMMDSKLKEESKTSTPESSKKRLSSDTESQMGAQESDLETSQENNKIELNSSDITVHQISEEELCEEGRRTHSLGDLSLSKPTDTTILERAQSLDITNSMHQKKLVPKKRKAPTDDDIMENKEMIDDPMNTYHCTLKSADQWGDLADAIFDSSKKINDESMNREGSVHDVPISEITIDLVKDVMNAVDKMEENSDMQVQEIPESNVMEIEKPARKRHSDSGAVITGMIEKKTSTLSNDPFANQILTINNLEPVQDIVKQTEQFMVQLSNEMVDNDSDVKIQMMPSSNYRVETQTMYLNDNGTDQVKIANYNTNVPDDVKVSRYPFNSLERPKSDVLKKLVSNKVETDDTSIQINSASMKPVVNETVTIESTYMEPQPVSLTLVNTSPVMENSEAQTNKSTPVYESDFHGVNSINISSLNVLPDITKMQENKNIVTISSSQPSSIITIEDENLDFTLQAPEEEDDPELVQFRQLENEVTKSQDEVFVIDMNGPQENEAFEKQASEIGNQNDDKHKGYVTEITVRSESAVKSPELAPKPPVKPTTVKAAEYVNGNGRKSSSVSPTNDASAKSKLSKMNNFHMQERRHTETNFVSRNNDIKFSTSTYESPLSKSFEKRSSHIEQIRSNFEKSDIPIPTRKSSIPTLKNGSPSKIPVFNSNAQRSPTSNSHNSHNGSNSNLTANSRSSSLSSVSISSIKNQSKQPSGK